MRTAWKFGFASVAAVIACACIASAEEAGAPQPAAAVIETQAPAPAAEAAPAGGLDAGRVKDAVNAYLDKDMKLKGGEFLLYDAADKKVVRLTKPVLQDSVRSQDANTSEVCVDMTSGKGKQKKTLDVDFFVVKDASGNLEVSDIKIHKVGKKERYIYDESNQVKPVPKKAKKSPRKKARAAE
jgi:hypothetical protein